MRAQTAATTDPRLEGADYRIVRHGRVGSLEEAAQLRGLPPSAVIKTMVVRRTADDYLFVLVPGDRVIDWTRLRSELGARRLTMADADEALAVTGYRRGTITPLGASSALPVVADFRLIDGVVSIGGGAPGVSISIEGEDLVSLLGATVADVTKPQD